MKYLIETSDISSLEQVSHLRVVHDTTRKIVTVGNYTPSPSTSVTVTIDDEEIKLDSTQTYAEQGYGTLYTQNYYAERESSNDYLVDCENTYPQDGDAYYTYCNEVINVTVYIDGKQTVLDSNRTFAQQRYTTMYDATDEMNEAEYPSKDGKYSTSYITIYVDGKEKTLSSHYTFAEQSKVGYLKVGDYGTSGYMKDVDNEKPIKKEKYTTHVEYTYIDGSQVYISNDYTFADQGYKTMYMYDATTDSMRKINCLIEHPDYDNQYSTDYITVKVDGKDASVSKHYPFISQGYGTLYSFGFIYENYNWWECYTDTPTENGKYSTDIISVTIDDSQVYISEYYTFKEHGFTTMYDVNNSMKTCIDCIDSKPQDGGKYSTDTISVTIDDSQVYISDYYTFKEHGFTTMYDFNDSMNTCIDSIPTKNGKYSTSMNQVYVDGDEEQMSKYYTFKEHGFTTMYDVNDSMKTCIDSKPQDGGKYSTDTISVTIDGKEKTLSSHYTFAKQGYDGTLYGKGDSDSQYYKLDPSKDYPQEYTRYLTKSKITVTIDNESVEVFPSLTFREQGYADVYKEVEGEDIDCADENPEEEGEYWTT